MKVGAVGADPKVAVTDTRYEAAGVTYRPAAFMELGRAIEAVVVPDRTYYMDDPVRAGSVPMTFCAYCSEPQIPGPNADVNDSRFWA